ncbi:ubiquitin-conjugating enzyme E2Q-like protein 1 isoform X2 [Centruroides sculpturatus]|uniref:ubiquitin-conjugating enzyme E2Q-like protein 1 isoform X1 n=1 Tax=Centruroides sculpturatus TaxID=218467 RepID=UPI000C6E219F|nr:ubiquitin-conjugating enzyme E2Q-like protein 1 isoform X1 [Centruroides sculpturatus]XP_023218751.1 ubiquitin-conjugating enzyme E2Q-like protein 1 isoform X2 [Centruroides sculpturatus]XP_023218752.1 ubiquitin-conjugating enzyme E2Q-like protein 1 isoform X2 [Centruroides sculpturatus]
MASAFRKLFKSTDRLSDERRKKNRGSPSRQFAARLLGQYESPRVSRRDSKISPADASVPATSKKSSKVDSVISESVMRHNQAVRTRRLMKEYQEMTRLMRNVEKPPYTVELVEDNLYDWNIKLHQIDPESDFYRDMQETHTPYVLININFPENFPFSPPFMRVISPHIEKGFVMEGGAICMELLTPRGWASAYTVEAVIMQFAASLVKGQGRIARKCKSGKEFNRKSAEASFRSLVKTHEKYGWVTPPLAEG